MARSYNHLTPLATLVAIMVLSTVADAKPITIGIDVRDPDTGALLARGAEDMQETEGKVLRQARYFDAKGKVVQTESSTYTVATNELESYSYRDPSTGEQVSVARDGDDHVQVTFREGDDVKQGRVLWSENTLHGKFIPERLLKHWDALLSGETIDFDLLVASRLETITFRARYDVKRSKNTNHPVFLVEANNFLIRAFAPDFTFVFDNAQDRQVIEYIGPSPIEIAGKRYPTVRLSFNN